MYKSLTYLTPDRDMIAAERDDGSRVVIEPESGEVWTLVTSGALGKIGKYVPPPPPTADELRAAMAPLTRRQVFYGMVKEGFASEDEAILAHTTGAPPVRIAAAFAALTEEDRLIARLKFGDFQKVQRTDGMVLILAQMSDPPLSEEQIDHFFETYARI